MSIPHPLGLRGDVLHLQARVATHSVNVGVKSTWVPVANYGIVSYWGYSHLCPAFRSLIKSFFTRMLKCPTATVMLPF